MTDEDHGTLTRFGFTWGPAEVTRCALLPEDRRVIEIKTPHRSLDVYVSATGRSVRVFSDGAELVAEAAHTTTTVGREARRSSV